MKIDEAFHAVREAQHEHLKSHIGWGAARAGTIRTSAEESEVFPGQGEKSENT